MTIAFVLGNGVSRKAVNLDHLKSHGTVYGCNALYREFSPDILVSTDSPISAAIQNSGYSQKNTHYTRKPLPNLGALKVPQKYFGYSSGPIAVGLAAAAGHSEIYLIGFDMGGTKQGTFNNVYADTEFYKKSSSVPTYSGNWVKQLVTISKEFLNTYFYRVVGGTTTIIPELEAIKNIRHVPVAEFLDRINNKKDL